MTRRMSAKEARDNFTDLLGLVYYGREPVIVERKGRPFAVVINPEEYERYQQIAKQRLFSLVEEIRKENRDRDPDEVMADVTAELEVVRHDRRDTAGRPRQ
jgi:prevent-host-death family protein